MGPGASLGAKCAAGHGAMQRLLLTPDSATHLHLQSALNPLIQGYILRREQRQSVDYCQLC